MRLKWLLFVLALCILLVSGGLLSLRHRAHDQLSFLPATAEREVKGFHLYDLKTGFSTDFTLQQDTINYQSGILVFALKNPGGKTLVFTEEATPAGYDISSLQADRHFVTEYGQAFITDGATRTTGALFTRDNTWILMNAPTPIGADLMQQFLEALQPSRNG